MLKKYKLCQHLFITLGTFLLANVALGAIYRPACDLSKGEGNTADLIADIVAANASANDDIVDLSGCTYVFTTSCVPSTGCTTDNALPLIGSAATAGKLSIINGSIQRSRKVTDPVIPNFRFLSVDIDADLSLFNLTLDFGRVSGGSPAGALYNKGSLRLENCILSNNTAQTGGAIHNDAPGVIKAIESSLISGNTSVNGGGIFNASNIININNSTFSDNTANSTGGGILNTSIITSINNSTFSGNSAIFGGGINNTNAITITSINNSTFSGNSADFGGGISNVLGSTIDTINNSTFSGNRANNGGGGINNESRISSLFSNIVASNTAPSGTDIRNLGPISDEGYNLLSNASGSPIVDGVNHDIVTSDLILLGLEDLQDNGGFTYTIALKPGSLAINNGLNPNSLAFDQRGRPFKRVACSRPDIGAFEFSKCHLLGDPVGE